MRKLSAVKRHKRRLAGLPVRSRSMRSEHTFRANTRRGWGSNGMVGDTTGEECNTTYLIWFSNQER
jgi:hypothetical protein